MLWQINKIYLLEPWKEKSSNFLFEEKLSMLIINDIYMYINLIIYF